ncbi:MAG: hypothetical protein QOF91_1629 [Alphaproteobacteria bacterium]|jgi:hypothetical protein|nr:hypothetical protein [Alphaproteobacteria bacterium]
MKPRIAIIAGALLCGGSLALTAATAAFAETTPNNSGRPLENLQQAPQGPAEVGYYVGSGAPAAGGKVAKPKARHHR